MCHIRAIAISSGVCSCSGLWGLRPPGASRCSARKLAAHSFPPPPPLNLGRRMPPHERVRARCFVPTGQFTSVTYRLKNVWWRGNEQPLAGGGGGKECAARHESRYAGLTSQRLAPGGRAALPLTRTWLRSNVWLEVSVTPRMGTHWFRQLAVAIPPFLCSFSRLVYPIFC